MHEPPDAVEAGTGRADDDLFAAGQLHPAAFGPKSPKFASPNPPSPHLSQDANTFLRRVKQGSQPLASPFPPRNLPSPSPPIWHEKQGGALGSPYASTGRNGSEAAAPPSTPLAKQFVRRDARQGRLRLDGTSARRVSFDSPMLAPLHAQDSPMSSASSQVSASRFFLEPTLKASTQSRPFLQAGSECSPTSSNALRDKGAWSLGGFSLGAAAAIKSGAGPSSREAAKTADEFHSRAYALRKRGNFEAAIEEYVVGARVCS